MNTSTNASMRASRSSAAVDLAQNARGVVSAVDMLTTALEGGDASDVEFAAGVLAQSADGYSGGTAQFARFGFDELAAAPAEPGIERERLATDLLASALIDLEVGSTLIAAGEATGETAETLSIDELVQARNRLEDLTTEVALPLSQEAPAGTARFALDEQPQPQEFAPSPDLPSAKAGYQSALQATYDLLAAEAKKVITQAFKGYEELDYEKLSEAISIAGKGLKELPSIGKLVNKGLALLKQALGKLTALLEKVDIQWIQDKAAQIIEQVKSGGELLDKFLFFSFNADNSRERILKDLERSTAEVDRVDEGARRLMELQSRFSEQMTVVSRIVKATSWARFLCAKLTPLPEGAIDAAAAAIYGLSMTFAIVSGMDFADASDKFQRVAGVVQISAETLM